MQENIFAPVALFAHARADKTQRVLDSLALNTYAEVTDVTVFHDAARNLKEEPAVLEVSKLLSEEQSKGRFKSFTIKTRRINYGLKNNVIAGVNEVFENSDKIIVLEDDTVPSKNFLFYMNGGLGAGKEEDIFSVSGFNFPKFLTESERIKTCNDLFYSEKPCSWGWGTWKDRWKKVNFDPNAPEILEFLSDKKAQKELARLGSNLPEMVRFAHEGKIDSWAIFFTFHAFKTKGLTLLPTKPLIKNIGFEGGTHFKSDDPIARIYDEADVDFDQEFPFFFTKIPNLNERYLKMSTTGNLKKMDKKLKKKILNIGLGFAAGLTLGVLLGII
jgi:hypothetical protein